MTASSQSSGPYTIYLPILHTLPNELRINEVVASNGSGYLDQDGDTSDWIELYKQGPTTVDLNGYYLTDDPANFTKWQFPSTLMTEGQHLVVFASGKDRAVSGSQLHTNFKLQSDGEYLALVEPDGTTIAWEMTPTYPPQYRDVSYGYDNAGRLRYFLQPTPKAQNGTDSADLGPLIQSTQHSPNVPFPTGDLTINATIAPNITSITTVRVYYRVNFGAEQNLRLYDDGIHDDGAAGDGVFGRTLPASIYGPSDLVRYRIITTDAAGNTAQWPLNHTIDSPQYEGTVVYDSGTNSQLPTLHWYVQDDVAAATRTGTRASLFYDGELYDNIFVRERGRYSATWPKKSFKFDFNQGHSFLYDPAMPRVTEINLNSTWEDPSHMRQLLAFDLFQRTGTPASNTLVMRVQQNGAFYSVANLIEQVDETFLVRHGFDEDGALYKSTCCNVLDGSTAFFEKKTRQDEPFTDLQAFINGFNQSSVTNRERFLLDHLNIQNAVNYLATSHLMLDWDNIVHNYYLYRDTEGSQQWSIIPWDKDNTFNADIVHDPVYNHPLFGEQLHEYPGGWNRLIDAMYQSDLIRELYLARLRTLMDEQMQPPSTPSSERIFEQRVAGLATTIAADAALDLARWQPAAEPYADEVYTLQGHFWGAHRQNLYVTYAGLIPSTPPAVTNIEFGTFDAVPSGGEDEEYLTLDNPNGFAVDISGWRLEDGVDLVFAPGTVIPASGRLYVVGDVLAFRGRVDWPRGNSGLLMAGPYSRNLDNEGESLRLISAENILIDTLTYTIP